MTDNFNQSDTYDSLEPAFSESSCCAPQSTGETFRSRCHLAGCDLASTIQSQETSSADWMAHLNRSADIRARFNNVSGIQPDDTGGWNTSWDQSVHPSTRVFKPCPIPSCPQTYFSLNFSPDILYEMGARSTDHCSAVRTTTYRPSSATQNLSHAPSTTRASARRKRMQMRSTVWVTGNTPTGGSDSSYHPVSISQSSGLHAALLGG